MTKTIFILFLLSIISCTTEIIPTTDNNTEIATSKEIVSKSDESIQHENYVSQAEIDYYEYIGSDSMIELLADKNWVKYDNDKEIKIEVDTTKVFKVKDLSIDIEWDNKLSFWKESHHGGIKKMTITKKGKKLQTIDSIQDVMGFGTISFDFIDYNFDGYMDFKMINTCGKGCYFDYYLFNLKTTKFEHIKSWNGIRIDRINKKLNLIHARQDGIAVDKYQEVYKINELEVTLINERPDFPLRRIYNEG